MPAAVCAASASSVIGIVFTPLLLGLLLGADTSILSSNALFTSLRKISLQILLPFIMGHVMRPIIGRWMDAHRGLVGTVDRSSILLVVSVAFSESVINGLWKVVSLNTLIWLFLACCALLTIVLGGNMWTTRRLSFKRADEVTVVFCGSKKSLTTGVPMAGVLYGAGAIGTMLLPLMIFHQIQLMVCAVLAQRYPHPEDAESTMSTYQPAQEK